MDFQLEASAELRLSPTKIGKNHIEKWWLDGFYYGFAYETWGFLVLKWEAHYDMKVWMGKYTYKNFDPRMKKKTMLNKVF